MTVSGIAAKKASEAIEQTKDLFKAAECLEKWALKDKVLYNCLTQPYLEDSCHEAVREGGNTKREHAWGKAGGVNQQGERLRRLAQDLLEDFIVNTEDGIGIPLKNATAADLTYAATRYKRQGEDMMHKHRWLLKIAKGLKGEKTVGRTFTNDELSKLKDKTL